MSEPYLIRKRGAWYRADYCGYTNEVRDAGVYDETSARREAAHEPRNIEAVPLRDYAATLRRERREGDEKLALLGLLPHPLVVVLAAGVVDGEMSDILNKITWSPTRIAVEEAWNVVRSYFTGSPL